jgi:DNA-binding transcriptional MerR regulator
MRFTVSELARRIAPGASKEEGWIVHRKVRHWTQIGVLPGGADSDVHTGSGRHRVYDSEDIRFAALALELAKWKLPVGPVKWILNTLHVNVEGEGRDVRYAALWQTALDGGGTVFLVVQAAGNAEDMDFSISLQADGTQLHTLIQPTDRYDSIGSLLVVDLTGIFRRLKK